MYDLVCVGGGIANLSLAYHYLLKDRNKKVLILDAGPDILKRSCPKVKTGYCVNCKPCRITAGFGGAGCFSDCKLTYSEEVGGTLIEYTGKERFHELQESAKQFFASLGANAPTYTHNDYFTNLKKSCEEHQLKLVDSEVQHLGTEGSYELMCKLYNTLLDMGCVIECNSEVSNISFDTKEVEFTQNNMYRRVFYDKLSIAVGRYGSEWLNKVCDIYGIEREQNTVDIGVRVEVPYEVCKEVTDNLYEMKIIKKIKNASVRTFCVNPLGYVVEEGY